MLGHSDGWRLTPLPPSRVLSDQTTSSSTFPAAGAGELAAANSSATPQTNEIEDTTRRCEIYGRVRSFPGCIGAWSIQESTTAGATQNLDSSLQIKCRNIFGEAQPRNTIADPYITYLFPHVYLPGVHCRLHAHHSL